MECRHRKIPIEFTRGDSYTLTCTYESINPAPPPVYLPIALGPTVAIYMTCKRYKNDADAAALFELLLGAGITITDAPNGKFTIVIPKAATGSPPCEVPYFYDVVIELNGARQTVMSGTLTLRENITDA